MCRERHHPGVCRAGASGKNSMACGTRCSEICARFSLRRKYVRLGSEITPARVNYGLFEDYVLLWDVPSWISLAKDKVFRSLHIFTNYPILSLKGNSFRMHIRL